MAFPKPHNSAKPKIKNGEVTFSYIDSHCGTQIVAKGEGVMWDRAEWVCESMYCATCKKRHRVEVEFVPFNGQEMLKGGLVRHLGILQAATAIRMKRGGIRWAI